MRGYTGLDFLYLAAHRIETESISNPTEKKRLKEGMGMQRKEVAGDTLQVRPRLVTVLIGCIAFSDLELIGIQRLEFGRTAGEAPGTRKNPYDADESSTQADWSVTRLTSFATKRRQMKMKRHCWQKFSKKD